MTIAYKAYKKGGTAHIAVPFFVSSGHDMRLKRQTRYVIMAIGAVLLELFPIAVGIRNGLIECGLEQAKAVYGDGAELHVAVGLEWLMGGYGLLTGCGRMESTWR